MFHAVTSIIFMIPETFKEHHRSRELERKDRVSSAFRLIVGADIGRFFAASSKVLGCQISFSYPSLGEVSILNQMITTCLRGDERRGGGDETMENGSW